MTARLPLFWNKAGIVQKDTLKYREIQKKAGRYRELQKKAGEYRKSGLKNI